MHRPVLQLANPPEPQLVNPRERQRVNHLLCASNQTHQHVNHLPYAKTHQRVRTVSLLEFLNLHVSQMEHPVIMVGIVEVVREEAVVLVGVVLEEAVEEEDNNHLI